MYGVRSDQQLPQQDSLSRVRHQRPPVTSSRCDESRLLDTQCPHEVLPIASTIRSAQDQGGN
jgi:hypothetical protein